MDDKLFDVFSEETEVPECVLRRVDETLEMIENSAESDKGYRKEEKRASRKAGNRHGTGFDGPFPGAVSGLAVELVFQGFGRRRGVSRCRKAGAKAVQCVRRPKRKNPDVGMHLSGRIQSIQGVVLQYAFLG